MPIFYYNLRCGNPLAEGTVGVHLLDQESARLQAKDAARYMLSQRSSMRFSLDGQIFEVCDEDG
ncbi:DUF6894 family protein [Pararhizobium sp. DWP3-4]|uniref:DUF6894 family protein n=1 Tax=Pararhizobium sp. DWP3-4 TaxID=2804565 RepID=UPI003CED6FFE